MLTNNVVQLIKEGSRRDRDPTLTLTLRNRLTSAYSGRFKKISARLKTSLVTDNFFSGHKISNNKNELSVNEYEYPVSAQKVNEFMAYVNSLIEAEIFERAIVFQAGNINQQIWSNTYIYSAYRAGLDRSNADLSRMGFSEFTSGSQFSLGGFLSAPIHIDALRTAYTRQYETLRGITTEMSAQISQILTTGIAEGRSPLELARKIDDRFKKIGITRAKRLARTEIVRAHNVAAINNYRQLDTLITDDLQVQWWTALDERVRSKHRAWHGEILSFTEAMRRIGEPNCRCAVLPYISSINAGEDLNIPYPGWRQANPEQ
jgi:SPP1 gp7 family putative phage head morphogenesis protein